MVKKKNKQLGKSFSEVIGLNNILQNDVVNFIVGLILIFLSIYVIIAFISFFSTGQYDQSLILDHNPQEVLNKNREFKNSCGSFGAFVSYFFISRCFGLSAFVIPIFMIMAGLRLVKAYKMNLLKWFICLMIAMIWFSVMAAKVLTPIMGDRIFNPGGDHGLYCSQWLENVIGVYGLMALLILSAIVFLTYLSKETINVVRNVLNPVSALTNKVKFDIKDASNKVVQPAGGVETLEDPTVFDDPETQTVTFAEGVGQESTQVNDVKADAVEAKSGNKNDGIQDMIINKVENERKADRKDVSGAKDLSVPINPREPWVNYKYPTLDLLKKYENDGKPYIDMKEQTANKNRIVEVLNSFGVQIKTIMATVGPTITLYEITPAEGVKISKIRNLEDDIALSLSALGIRIIAPIPGKGTIGIEVPNRRQNIVSMESILNSKRFQETTMELPIAIGKTITNEIFMVDLAKLPLDPKKVEFSVYAPIAQHFMAKVPDDNEEPIITDVKKVIRTLNSLCKLMDARYDLLKLAGARNIKEYNKKYVNHQLRLTDGHEYMPYIVVIIDEFGDLIMTAGKEIELPIARIAQLARAVGIHMVIATQRPTASIITGNIKANFPGRMAFRVSAMIDSRTILDRPGANQLIGRGDLLFLNGNEPVRVQCAFIDTPEIERINQYIASQPGPLEPMELPEPTTDDGGDDNVKGGLEGHSIDPLFGEAARLIVLSQQGSASMIQRKFSIGYNRAGRIMDQLEKAGVVGAAQGSKPREVLIQDENSLEALLAQLKQ